MATTAGYSLSPELPLRDRGAIVTGSSRGIGKAIPLHLASLGAKFVVNYISNSTLAHKVIHEINSSWTVASPSPQAIVVQANVSNPSQVKALFDTTKKTFEDQVHILVACVGIIDATFSTITNMTAELFEKVLNVNTKGAFLCIREAASRLKRGGGGRIVTFLIGAPSSLQDGPTCGTYLVSTAAVKEMTKVLAKEFKGTKITADCVSPGPIVTEAFLLVTGEEVIKMCLNRSPLLRLGESKDVPAVVGFLVGDDGEWVNGQVILVHGGSWS